MVKSNKKTLILLPLSLGFVLILYSWWISYPLSIDSPYDFIFNHVSPMYWLGLSLILGSLYGIAAMVRNSTLKLIACAGIVIGILSIRFFYYSLPGTDVQYFRGLTEYYVETSDLDPSKPVHSYFNWPIFFILNKVAHSVTGLGTMQFEFLLVTTLATLYVLSLYIYSSRFSKDGGYIAVIALFIMLFWFLNVQFAPFSLAIGSLYTLFMLETNTHRRREVTFAVMILFIPLTLEHPFMAIFFIVYTFAMYITNRNMIYSILFLLTTLIYLTVSIHTGFFQDVVEALTRSTYPYEYTSVVQRTFSEPIAPTPPIAFVARIFSRVITFATIGIAGLGFLFLIIKRRLRSFDSAIFIAALLLVASAAIVHLLDMYVLSFLFIPLSLGTIYLVEERVKHLRFAFLALLILFPLIPLKQSFDDNEIMFQTAETYQCANFLVDYYNWTRPSSVFSHFRLMRYLQTRPINVSRETSFSFDDLNFTENIFNSDCIVYTVGVGKSCLFQNCSITELLKEDKYNRVFDTGSSYILIEN